MKNLVGKISPICSFLQLELLFLAQQAGAMWPQDAVHTNDYALFFKQSVLSLQFAETHTFKFNGK